MNEKMFKRLSWVGVMEIVTGIVIAVAGLSVGVLSVLCGAKTLGLKKNIMI